MSQSSGCAVNYFCIGGFLIFVGSILLCTLGFIIVLPYEATRDWNQVTCRVLNVSISSFACSCQRQLTQYESCINKYPCLQIYVAYTAEDIAGVVYESNGKWSNQTTFDHDVNATFVDESDISRENRSKKPYSVQRTKSPDTRHELKVNLKRLHPTERHVFNQKSPGTNNAHRHHMKDLENESKPYFVKVGNGDAGNLSFGAGTKSDILSRESHAQNRTSERRDGEIKAMLFRNWDDSFHEMCTLQECGDEEWNVKVTSRFRLQWGRDNLNFPCFYNPKNQTQVVAERTSHSTTIHAILWPIISLLSGVGLWVGQCLGCYGVKKKPVDAEPMKVTSRRRQHGFLHAPVTVPS